MQPCSSAARDQYASAGKKPRRGLVLLILLAENFGVDILVEANEYRFAGDQAGRAKIPGWAQHGVHCGFRCFSTGRKLVDFFALRDNQSGCLFRDFGGVTSAEFPTRGDKFLGFNGFGIQKLGRFCARRSALAVVVPIQSLCHFVYASLSIFLGGLKMVAGRLAELAYRRKRFAVVDSVDRASHDCIGLIRHHLRFCHGKGEFRDLFASVSLELRRCLIQPILPWSTWRITTVPGKIVWMMGGSSGIGTDSRRFERSEKPVV